MYIRNAQDSEIKERILVIVVVVYPSYTRNLALQYWKEYVVKYIKLKRKYGNYPSNEYNMRKQWI